MQESNAELSEKSGMLQAEKKLLEEDIKRWKARTQVRSLSILRFCLQKLCICHWCKSLGHHYTFFWCLAPGEPAERH